MLLYYIIIIIIINLFVCFQSTQNFQGGHSQLFSEFEKYGTIWDAQSTKDLFIYAANCHLAGLRRVIKLIADNVRRPLFTHQEVAYYILLICFSC